MPICGSNNGEFNLRVNNRWASWLMRMVRPPDLQRPLEWSDAFSVGHVVLDAEHRGLMTAINNFRTAQAQDDVEYRRTLFQSLVLLAEHHFDHESSILQKIIEAGPEIAEEAKSVGQTAIREHISAHTSALHELIAMTQKAGSDPDLYNSLKAWFVDHAVNHDAHMKTVFQAM